MAGARPKLGLPLIDQKTKALITIAIDVVNQDQARPPAIRLAPTFKWPIKQGATRVEEIEELLLFLCRFTPVSTKVAGCFGALRRRLLGTS